MKTLRKELLKQAKKCVKRVEKNLRHFDTSIKKKVNEGALTDANGESSMAQTREDIRGDIE